MNTEIHINFFSVFIFIGIVQGLILSYYFIKNGGGKRIANVFQGILLLTLSLGMLEEFLNETGYIVQVLWLSNFSEPFNFVYPPLFYLYIKLSLNPEFKKKDLLHFLVFLLWLGNMMFYFTEPNEWKYNSYIDSKHPDWSYLNIPPTHNEDPLGIRDFIDWILPVYFITYMYFSIRLLLRKCKNEGIPLFQTTDNRIISLRNTTIHFILIVAIFIVVRASYQGDLGDHFISVYISFMILLTGFRIINTSSYFNQTASFLEFPLTKYQKSTLQETDKTAILQKVETEMMTNKYYLSNLASLEGLSKIIMTSKHHVSQVINEKLQMNFFELLAKYRVEEARRIILADDERKVTIEDLADRVGYNSKSSFNTAFKKFTGMTPSQFRDQGHQGQ